MFGCSKSTGGSNYEKIAMMLAGIGMILFASFCFREVPLIGTVFVMPGESVMNARRVDPVLRYALFLLGGLFAAQGVQLQIRIGFSNPLKESNQNTIIGKPVSRRKPWRKPWDLGQRNNKSGAVS